MHGPRLVNQLWKKKLKKSQKKKHAKNNTTKGHKKFRSNLKTNQRAKFCRLRQKKNGSLEIKMGQPASSGNPSSLSG